MHRNLASPLQLSITLRAFSYRAMFTSTFAIQWVLFVDCAIDVMLKQNLMSIAIISVEIKLFCGSAYCSF